ncbi:hypothetical protein OG594_09220 [Streptomyces sp. NBC_01214]|uniref:hypothetical protein n=1 Tax=Streptomyces sp. NBC_01214 TaxID=2903777 RepID=UPI002252F05A|nr:hypothetical protein [Streptomyces sp. NBC_01214]MCX4801827.1 hypothetical protein [Streptomyces sp. NBC_01214]
MRKALIEAASSLFMLQRGLPYAPQVGVLEAAIEGLENGINQSEEFVWSTAQRVAAVANLAISRQHKKLPPEAKELFDRDSAHLASITRAAKEAHEGLTIAIAAGHGTSASQSADAAMALDNVRQAIQQLSHPNRS